MNGIIGFFIISIILLIVAISIWVSAAKTKDPNPYNIIFGIFAFAGSLIFLRGGLVASGIIEVVEDEKNN